ncbi:MAG: hypothetical protein Q4D03_05355 [Bacteroidales bacterium]|nr:hypothetical protein [Bacteroidales bacterium]
MKANTHFIQHKKSNRRYHLTALVVLLTLLIQPIDTKACGPFYWVYEVTQVPEYYFTPFNVRLNRDQNFVDYNCELWKEQVGGNVTIEDVRDAIYNYDLSVWEKIEGHVCEDSRQLLFSSHLQNSFIQRLIKTHDTTSVRLLCYSKRYEVIRGIQLDPWNYHPSQHPEEDLRRCADYGKACFDRTHSERALLLATKALFTLKADKECIQLWKKAEPYVNVLALREKIEGYVAGCMARQGDIEGASTIYMRIGDLESLLQLNGKKSLMDLTEAIYTQNPNASMLTEAVQYMLLKWHWPYVDLDPRYLTYQLTPSEKDDNNRQRLMALATKAINNPKVLNEALWHYVAACLYDYQGQSDMVLLMLEDYDQTEGVTKDFGTISFKDWNYLQDAIHMLRCKQLLQTTPMGKDYEQLLQEYQLWLENRWAQLSKKLSSPMLSYLQNNQPHQLYMGFTDDFTYAVYSPSVSELSQMVYLQLQWRQMVIQYALPRLLYYGQSIRALQVANAVENSFFITTHNQALTYLRTQTLPDLDAQDFFYYYSGNGFDYCNEAFLLADSMDAQTLVNYWECIQSNRVDDKFWNSRSYTDKDYWYEQIGTHWMRQEEFATAVMWLQQVADDYQNKTNLRSWYLYDPFQASTVRWNHPKQAKLQFARRMAELKNQMEYAASSDEKGLAGVLYATALNNAADQCWSLLSYGKGYETFEWDEKHSVFIKTGYETESYWGRCYNHILPSYLKNRASWTLQHSLSMIQDPEVLAQVHSYLGHISLVVKQYTHTTTAQYYARHCDEWKDYII